MNKTSIFPFLYYRYKALAASIFILIFSLPTNAGNITGNGIIAEYNFAVVLGMTIPVMLFLILLKPMAPIRRRYPAILSVTLSVTLLVQLYALNYLQGNQAIQTTVLMLSAGVFISAILFTTVVDKLIGKIKLVFVVISGALLFIFSFSILFFSTINKELIWLGFIALNLLIVLISLLLLKKKSDIHIVRESLTCLLVILYSAALYFWLTTNVVEPSLASGVSDFSSNFLSCFLVINAVAIYLMFIANYCWSVAKHNLIEHKTVSAQALEIEQTNANDTTFDPITNLPSYHHGLRCLRHYNNHDPSALAIIVFKPINFSQVNKVLGHHNSDILLLQLAYSLQKVLVDNELLVNFNQAKAPIRLARLQGLDFVVALDTSASHHPAKIIVEQLCQQLKEAVPSAMSFKSFSLNFELKFGVTFVSHHQNNLEQAIAFAGDALLASEQSHQSIRYYNQDAAIYTEQKLLIMEKLKQDIVENKLSWLLQPQISLNESRLIGFELFTNWRSTNGNSLDIKEFIEIAEYSGEIYHLTRQIIEQACRLIARLHRENFYIQVSVNLSSKDVLEHDLIEFIEQMAEKHHVALRYLVIEIDEALLFKGADKTKQIIDQLKSIGVKVSINNFSGSYEALRYLRRLAIDQIKVDCSQLVGSLHEGQSEKTIISALINLIRKMKIPLIASGINNSAIKNTYIDIGGDIGQGNLITDGIQLADAKKWTSQWLVDHVGGN